MYLRYWRATVAVTGLAIIYLLQALLVKPDPAILNKYHISAGQLIGVTMAVLLPYVIIWFIALSGYLSFRCYTDTIRKSKDGEAFREIRRGLLWLLMWLPVSAVYTSLATQYYHVHPESTANLIRANIYINLFLLYPGFILVNRGSQKLKELVKSTIQTPTRTYNLIFLAFSSLYTFLVVSDPAAQHSTASTPIASYYMPDWLIVVAVVIPRLILWYLGVQAAQNIYAYKRKVKGIIYKHALTNMARGIAGVVFATIALRSYQSLSSQVGELSLGLVLVVVYILLIIIATAYLLIAKGSKSLAKIENLP